MNKHTEKLRLIYLPFLIIAISIIGGYTFLNWLILIKLQLFQIKEIAVNFIIPFFLPWIPVAIWLRPRIKLLKFETTKIRDPYLLYQFIAVLAIAIPTMNAQEYLSSATGKLTEIDTISQIDKHEATKFYKLKKFSIDKRNIGIDREFQVSGKSSQDLYISLYIVCPILPNDTTKNEQKSDSKPLLVINGKPYPGMELSMIPKEKIISINDLSVFAAFQLYGESAKNGAIVVSTREFNIKTDTIITKTNSILTDTVKSWLGIEYKERINNRLSVGEKEKLINDFLKDSQRDFEIKDLSKFVYLNRLGYTDELEGYKKAIHNSNALHYSNTVLISVNEPFEYRNGNKLAWILSSFGIGALILLLMLLSPDLNEKEMKVNRIERLKNIKSKAIEFFSFFIPREGFYMTCIIFDLNILVFLVMVFSGLGFITFQGSDLLEWGANYKPITTDGEWWRLLTNTFLHGGIMHLFANMYGLLFVGIFLEPRIGKTKFAVIYLVSGILASITSLWWHDATISVGASGAIFGLFGLFLALMVTKVYPKEFSKALMLSTLIFVGFNLLFGLTGGIDNAAHIGGLISGIVIGLFISPQLKKETENFIIVEKNEIENNNP